MSRIFENSVVKCVKLSDLLTSPYLTFLNSIRKYQLCLWEYQYQCLWIWS